MKKIIKIVCVSLGSILFSALLAFGIFTLIKNKNVAETGNVLGVTWYNETDREFIITTVEELYEVAELSKFYDFKGQTIKLDADIVVNEGKAEDWAKNAPKKKWKPIDRFAGTFDGQGHTISGLYAKVGGAKFAMFTNTSQNCTIKNMKLVNTYFESRGLDGLASIACAGGGKFYQLYSDAILECKGEKVAGLMSMIQKASKFEECWFDGYIHTTNRDAGGLVDDIYNSRVEMKHCLFSGTIEQDYTLAGTRTGGICGKVRDNASLIMSDCLVTGELIAEKTVYSGSLVGVVYSGCQLATTDCYISADAYHLLIGESGDQGAINGRPLQMPNDVLVGAKAYEWTTLNFDKYWAAVEGDTPVLKCFGEKGMSLEGLEKAFDVSWYTPGINIYELTTLKQLYGFYILSGSNTFAEHTIKLGADIVVNEGNAKNWAKTTPENPWFAINKFAGIFDGQGHTISGIYLKNQMTYQGFFGQVEPSGIVRNFNLKNSYFCNDSDKKLAMLGSIAGEFRGKLENVYSNAIVECSGIQAGGIFGRTNDNDDDGKEDKVVITNSWFDGELRMKGQGGRYGGGFVGMVVQGDLDITHCLNTGDISAEAVNIGVHVGGFVGSTMNKGVINMNDCLSAGTMDMAYGICVGSVFGRSEGETRTVNLTNVYATQECYPETFFGTGEGGATTAKVNGGAVPLPKKMVTGYTAYQWTELDFAKNWAVVKDGTPILKNFAKSVPSLAGQKKMIDLKWYQPTKKSYTIKTANELRGLALLSNGDSFKDKTIKLGADINLGKNIWMTIGTINDPFLGTFDGQGHTISGVSFDTKEYYGGLFGVAASGAVIQNFRLTDSDFKYSGESAAIMGSIVGDLYGGAKLQNVYSNATVVSCGSQAGGLVGRVNDNDEDKKADKAVISNCWFDGTLTLTGETTIQGGGIVGRLFRGDLELTHCLNTGSISSDATGRAVQLGGIVGAANGIGTFNLTDSLNTGKITVAYDNGAGSVIGRTSCDEKNDRIVNIKNTYASTESYKSTFGNNTNVIINGGTIPLKEKMLTGYTAYQWTTLDFAKNWAVEETSTPILQVFATNIPSLADQKKLIDTKWYQEDVEKYEIKTAAELRGFALMAQGDTFKDKTIVLKADIDLKDKEWIPVGSEAKNFLGTFDGKSHTISGVSLDTKEYYGGLFGVVGSGATVKNFELTDSSFTYSGTSGAIMGSVVGDLYGGATLENVYSNATVVSCGGQAGGLVGRVNDSDADEKEDKTVISNCWFDGTFSLKGETTVYGGGIVGRLFRGDLDMLHCLNTGSVSSEASGRALQLGGLIGTANGVGVLNLTDSLNIGKITVSYDNGVGSIIGRVSCDNQDDRIVNIKDTYASVESYKSTFGNSSNAKIKNASISMQKSFLNGYTAYQWTTLDFTDSWAVVEDDTPVLQVFATNVPSVADQKKLIDTRWYQSDAENYEIKTAEELRGFALMAQADTFKDKTIVLKADIDLKNKEWMPIGSSRMPFAGTFDGKGHTISGLYLNTTEKSAGMFGTTGANVTIKNFKLVDSYMQSTGDYLGLVGTAQNITIEKVYTNAKMTTGNRVGGFVGMLGTKSSTATFNNCWFDGEVVSTAGAMASGFVGYVGAQLELKFNNCLSAGVVNCKSGYRAGGFVGWLDYGWAGAADKWVFNNCLSVANMSGGSSMTGAYIGQIATNATSWTMNHSYGIGEKLVGTASSGTVPANCLKTRDALCAADVSTLFTSDAWVNDNQNGWNNTDRGTPILASFAEWWLPRQPEPTYTVDMSWYNDSDATFTLYDMADVRGFVAIANNKDNFAGKTIKLGADIVVNTPDVAAWKAGTKVPGNIWTPIGTSAKPFAGTFDGKGYTISGLYLNTTDDIAGMFGYTGSTATIKNFKLVDSYMKSTGTYLGLVGTAQNITIEKVYTNAYMTIDDRVAGFVGVLRTAAKTATFNNCWFDGEAVSTAGALASGFVGFVGAQLEMEFNNCLSTGKITSPYRAGGFVGWIDSGWYVSGKGWQTNKWRFNNCLSTGNVSGSSTQTGSYIGQVGTNAVSLTINHSYGVGSSMVGTYASSTTAETKALIETSTNLKTRDALIKADVTTLFPESNAWVNGNTTGWNNTDRGTPILATFAEWWIAKVKHNELTVDFSWYNNSDTKFTLHDAGDLAGLAYLVNNTSEQFTGKTIKLGADIVVNTPDVAAWKAGTKVPDNKWTPIGTSAKPFAGTFDGQGYTISGLYLNTTDAYAGMFGYMGSTATIKNFRLVDSYMKSTGDYLGLVGTAQNITIEKVYTNAYMTIDDRVAGFVGILKTASTTATFNNCWFDGEAVSTAGALASGFVGFVGAQLEMEFNNCLSTGKITSPYRAGGFVGWIDSGWYVSGKGWQTNKWRFNNCLSVGTLSGGSTQTGSYIGQVGTNAVSLTINHSYGVGSCMVGTYASSTTAATKALIETSTNLKTKEALIQADETTLFPALSGETENAWVARESEVPALRAFVK